jgi:lysophospholipase L1-like esterase
MGDLRSEIRAWIGTVWVRYVCFVLGLVLLVLLAGIRHRVGIALGLILLLFLSSWLNDLVRIDRKQQPDHARARVALAIIQLIVGVVLVLVATGSTTVTNVALFLGLSLVTLSAAALISEGRQAKVVRNTAPWLLGLALLLVVVSLVLPFGLALGLAIAGALVIGEIGTEFLSEAVVPTAPTDGLAAFVVGGVVVLGGCVLLMLALNVPWPIAIVAVVAFLALELMALSNADALAVIVVVALALTRASAPRTDDTAAARAPAKGQDYFLVLGDSYISGEGAPRYYRGTNLITNDPDHTNECRRAPTAWPELLASSPPGTLPNKLLFLACSGAVTENISTRPRIGDDGEQKGPAELGVFERLRKENDLGPPKVVFLSIGGNDASFGTIGTTCVGPGDCAEIGQQFLDDPDTPNIPAPTDVDAPPGPGKDEDLAGIADDLDIAYKRVRASVGPDVPVVVVPYPIPLGTSASCSAVLLDDHEKVFLRRFVLELDQVIESAAHRAGFSFMKDVENALTNRGGALCDTSGGRSGLNFVTLNPKEGTARESLNPTNWFHNSLHPNPQGHDAIRDAAVDFLRASPDLEPLPADGGDRYEVKTIDELMADPGPGVSPVTACHPPAATRCQLEHSGWEHDQFRRLVRKSAFPILFGLLGAWLLLLPLVRYGRSIQLSLMKVLRGALAPPAD